MFYKIILISPTKVLELEEKLFEVCKRLERENS